MMRFKVDENLHDDVAEGRQKGHSALSLTMQVLGVTASLSDDKMRSRTSPGLRHLP
jgi:hypothetical protein